MLTPAQHNLVGDNHLRKSYKIHIYLLYHNITPLWHTNTEWGGWCACVFSYWCKHGDWLTTTWSRQEAHQGSLHLQSCIIAIRVVREVAYRANVTGGIASAVASLSDLPKDLKSMVNGCTSQYIGLISIQKNGSRVLMQERGFTGIVAEAARNNVWSVDLQLRPNTVALHYQQYNVCIHRRVRHVQRWRDTSQSKHKLKQKKWNYSYGTFNKKVKRSTGVVQVRADYFTRTDIPLFGYGHSFLKVRA